MLDRPSATLRRGAHLRYPIRDAQGVLLLAQGAEVTDHLLDLLRVRGITLELFGSLRVRQGGSEGLEIPVRKDMLLIGRRPDCDVQLADAAVSGHHCRVCRQPGGLFVEDLGSCNGTYLNGQQVAWHAELSQGDRLRVGGVTFDIDLFAALAADTEEGNRALGAWVLAAPPPGRATAAPYDRTLPELDLGPPP